MADVGSAVQKKEFNCTKKGDKNHVSQRHGRAKRDLNVGNTPPLPRMWRKADKGLSLSGGGK